MALEGQCLEKAGKIVHINNDLTVPDENKLLKAKVGYCCKIPVVTQQGVCCLTCAVTWEIAVATLNCASAVRTPRPAPTLPSQSKGVPERCLFHFPNTHNGIPQAVAQRFENTNKQTGPT